MKTETGRLSRAFIFAIVLHVVFLSLLIVSFEWTPKTPTAGPATHVVKAVAVDEKKVQAEMRKLQQAKDRAREQKESQLKRVQQQLAQERQRLKEMEQKRHDAAAKRKAEEQRLAAAQAKKDKEAKRLADLKQKQQAEADRLQKIKEQQAAAEKQRRAEEQRQAELKAQQEKERQQKAEEERRRKEAEQALQQQLAEEKAQRDQGVVEQYIGLIKQKVTRNWVRPAGWQTGQNCEVHIQLIPDGEVVNVQVVNSCGSPLSDQSVETAVTRASPLPLPPDPTLFNQFRDIKFIFNPKE